MRQSRACKMVASHAFALSLRPDNKRASCAITLGAFASAISQRAQSRPDLHCAQEEGGDIDNYPDIAPVCANTLGLVLILCFSAHTQWPAQRAQAATFFCCLCCCCCCWTQTTGARASAKSLISHTVEHRVLEFVVCSQPVALL